MRHRVLPQVTAGCGHHFCRGCVTDLMTSAAEEAALQCPTCGVNLSVDLNAASSAAAADGGGASSSGKRGKGILSRLDLRQFQSSTKVRSRPRRKCRPPTALPITPRESTMLLRLLPPS